MLWKENKYHRRLQSTSRLQCTKLISLCYSPKVFPFFISNVQPPQWGNMKEKAECSKDGFVFAIYVNLACFSVFTERSIPKLQGPTLSKMNNLIMITLNFLFCHNCLCNILPDFFSVPNRHDWNQSRAACLFHGGDRNCFFNDFDLQLLTDLERRLAKLLSAEPWCLLIYPNVCTVFKWLCWLIFKHFKWIQSSHKLVFLAPYLALSISLQHQWGQQPSTIPLCYIHSTTEICLRSCISIRMWISVLHMAHQWIMARCSPKDTTDLLSRWKITSTSKKSS